MGMKGILKNLRLAAAALCFAAPSFAGPVLPAALDPFTGAALDLAAPVPAPAAAAVEDPRVYYIAPWAVEASAVPPPPPPGSAADRADLAEVLRWQEVRTPAQCQAAWLQADANYDSFFGEISPFGAPAPAAVEKIFKKVRLDTGSIDLVFKRKYQRPRPFDRDSAVTPCLDREGGYSYPSGHSTVAKVFALMLAELRPAQADRYNAYADQAALNRVIGGVHHPSDIEAGKRLGAAVFQALKSSPEFQADMKTLRRNLRK